MPLLFTSARSDIPGGHRRSTIGWRRIMVLHCHDTNPEPTPQGLGVSFSSDLRRSSATVSSSNPFRLHRTPYEVSADVADRSGTAAEKSFAVEFFQITLRATDWLADYWSGQLHAQLRSGLTVRARAYRIVSGKFKASWDAEHFRSLFPKSRTTLSRSLALWCYVIDRMRSGCALYTPA